MKDKEDTPMRAPKWAFLGGGFVAPRLDEDVLAIAAATKPDGTYEIPDRWASSVIAGKILIPIESKVIGMRWGCSGVILRF
jgi:hypothetical protein